MSVFRFREIIASLRRRFARIVPPDPLLALAQSKGFDGPPHRTETSRRKIKRAAKLRRKR